MTRAILVAGLAGIATATLCAGEAGATESRPWAPSPTCDSTPLAITDGARCLSDDSGTMFGLRATHSMPVGTIETSASLSSQSSNAFTPERLIASDGRRIGQSNRVMIGGVKARLLDDRVTLTTKFGWSDFVDQGQPRGEVRDGSARMIRLDLKLVDRPALRWSVAGEMSDVSDNFFIGQAVSEGAQLALPGKRLALSTAVGWQQARLTAGHEVYRNSFGSFVTTRFGASRKGVSLNLRSSSGSLRNPQAASLLSGSTQTHSATLEIDLATMMPALAMDQGLPAALVPRHVVIGWRGGRSETLYSGFAERFERQGLEFNALWETPIGETSFGYFRDRRIGATHDLGRRDEKIVQLSHLVRKGNWRFGADAMVATTTSTRGAGLADHTVALGGSIAYEVAGGPRLMIQLSDDRARMAADDDSFLTARRGQQVSASLDLTDMLRKRFERPDLRLRIDYRKQLDRSTSEVSAYQQLVDRWTDGQSGEGVLVSFGMKL